MFQKLKLMAGNLIAALGVVAASSMTAAHAALPVAVGTAFTDLLADIQSLIDLAWTVVVPVTIAFIIIGMFKRSAYSAT